jgi:hypothetical protein
MKYLFVAFTLSMLGCSSARLITNDKSAWINYSEGNMIRVVHCDIENGNPVCREPLLLKPEGKN